MGNTWADKIGSGNSLRQIGEGRSLPPDQVPQYSAVSFKSWQRGMVSYLSPENTPEDAGRDVIDIEIGQDDSLNRPPGFSTAEDVTPRLLHWLFQQAGLDYTTELVVIDAPYLGYKSSGTFTFVNAGIAAPGVNGWNAVNILGILVFSDGRTQTYARAPGAAVVTDISADIIARTFANVFGRTFAGAWTDPIDGLQGLGIKWTGTSGLYNDWAGAGSGEELLIANVLDADKIVALRPIGFDALGILCRTSLWIGFPTGQADRPADFRLRAVGTGCVTERCAAVCPSGIVFLSDEGLQLFNQNELRLLSEAINQDLLPIDYTQLDSYSVMWDSSNQSVKLVTPTCTWIFEFEVPPAHPERWTRRSFVPELFVMFTDQSGNLYWATVDGTWADQTLTWAEMIENQEDAAPKLYAADGSILAIEDLAVETYLGADMTPQWETLQASKDAITEIVTTVGFEIEYSSMAASDIAFELPDENGDFTQSISQALVSTAGKRRRAMIWGTSTGQGAKLRYSIVSGRPKLFSIKQLIMDSGPATVSAS